ncbi:MAG: hypothetical protein E4H15_02255 [Syntrophobacterales bacterium]|nr:MAG: hypothetical protein E4H15_02255 [Syntrophobacterales bacterium]
MPEHAIVTNETVEKQIAHLRSWVPGHIPSMIIGTLYAGGDFTTAGGNPANNIAKWGVDTSIPSLSYFGMIGFALLVLGSALWTTRFRKRI